jgi:hypothetical protein
MFSADENEAEINRACFPKRQRLAPTHEFWIKRREAWAQL